VSAPVIRNSRRSCERKMTPVGVIFESCSANVRSLAGVNSE
jgi:hypothetical protein